MTAEGVRRGDSGKEWRGYDPTLRGRHWAIPDFVYDLLEEDITELPLLKKLDHLRSKGMVYFPDKDGGQPRILRPLTDSVGNFLMDLWSYQPYTNGIYEKSDEGIDEDVGWSISKFRTHRIPDTKTGRFTQQGDSFLNG